MKTDLKNLHGRCLNCGSKELVTDCNSGEVVCSKCGLVIGELMLDQKPEWRAFNFEERRAMDRVGSPSSYSKYDKGLSTFFQSNRDAFGRPLPAKMRSKIMRLRRWNLRAIRFTSMGRNLSQAMNELTRLTDKLNVPKSVEENAALLYRKLLDKDLIRGRSIKNLAAASLYAACRLTQTPRSLNEIAEASIRRRKDISKCYRLLQRELKMTMPMDDPAKYLSKIASQVRLNQKTQNMALQLLKEAKKRNAVAGKGPVGMAAAALYISAALNGEKVTQREVAKAAKVTEVTVRNLYKGLDRLFDLGLRKG
jgi:transcription initiation factor TFIIB